MMVAIMGGVKINWSKILFGILKAMVDPSTKQVSGFTVQLSPLLEGAPGSDHIHRESGTSTVGGGRSPNPVHDWKQDSFDHGKAPSNIAHDPLGITDSAYKNQLVVVSIQYGPFNTYIPIRSTTIGKSRVARDPITMHTSRRSNSDIACVTRVSMSFRVVRTNQYNQDLGLIHSINGNHLESPNESSSIDHQVTIHLHAQNITMFPTNETWYFTSQMLVSSSGGLILILMAQSTRNEFIIHSYHSFSAGHGVDPAGNAAGGG
ncbi:hypothetical protein F511_17153 [Dorcoceras hygrometricum]|uniref:Triacylglycerol lipase n=1 Tax=Dorcoceras hygrometricum TaxID=472368 RepID=A0A2Z7AFZ1_9LAMI|nr:hypothetical protein F511_17153 [Dorcoceras hygrometricum]